MRHVVNAALMAALLAGCADTPTQDASIEERAVASKDVGGRVATGTLPKAVVFAPVEPAKPAETVRPVEIAKPVEPVKPAVKSGEKVETRGLTAPDTEVKSLATDQGSSKSADSQPGAGAGKAADATSRSGTVSGTVSGADQAGAPVLDPRNPASPLAQRRILFDYDSAAIRDDYRSLLEAHAHYLKQEKAARTILQGHADERGSREYNLALGQRRAESVYKALNLLGVPDEQMEAVSLGEEKPVAEGHDEEAWKQNRRTEILYQGE